MTNYGVGLQYQNALQDFEEHGYCVVRGMLSEDALRPVRELIDGYIDARAQSLLADGHIADACEDAPFESKWARVRAQVADQSREGPIGATSNWGVPSQLGELLLAEPVHRLYRSSALTTLASSILEDDDVFACGNYWVRPMTSGDPQGHYPLHQGASQPRAITRAHGG